MHAIRGQALPSSFLEHPYEKNDSSRAHGGKKSKASPSSITTTPSPHDSETKGKDRGNDAAPNDSSISSSSSKKDKKKAKKAKKAKKDEIKGISSIVSASLMTTTAVLNHGGMVPKAVAAATVTASSALLPLPNRDRSGSTASQRSNKSSHGATEDESQPINNSAPFALLPPLLSIDDTSIPSINSVDGQGPQHHSSRLTSFLKRRKNSSSTTLSLDYTSLASTSSSSLQLPSSQSTHSQLQLHTITMVTQSDVHITWPHPVPSGNAYIAGTWSVPGHGPWEKLPMSRIPGTDSFEVHLDVQEIENVSEYVDEDGYINHDLLDSSSSPHDPTSTQPPASPSSTPTATLSKRQRISRFFGRARSLSSSSNSPSSSKDPQHELPYHHHSKDGIILPFTKRYCYQYKFVIDDEWKCDPHRAQVQDSHGHLNHELNVELIEQIHQPANRSRSSSLQSQHSIPVSESTAATSVLLSEPLQPVQSQPEEQAKTETETEIKTELAQEIPLTTDVTPPVSTHRNRKPSTTTTKRRKPKDSYEAVLIFDERDDLSDDLSDGDGHLQYMSDTESEADAAVSSGDFVVASHDDGATPQQQQQEQGVQPQQDKHAVPEEKGANNNNNNNNVDVSAVATIATLSATAAEATEPTGQKDSQDEIAVETIIPRNIGPDATVPEEPQEDSAVSLPIADEVAPVSKEDFTPTISIEDVSIAAPLSTDVAVEDTPTVPVVDEADPVVKEDSSQAVAIEAPQSVNVAVEQSSPAMKEEPKAFVLQEAANPEEYATSTQQDVSQQYPRPPSRAALEIVTDPNMTNKTNSTSYSQVPSPPLTPSSMYEAQGDTDLDDEDLSDADFDAEKYAALESLALLTPRAETTTPRLAPLMKEVTNEPVIVAVQPRGLVGEQLPKEEKVYQRIPSTRSLSTPSSVPIARHREKGIVEDDKKSKKEAVYERYPNLLWSLCKTTVVVSAAVVVLGIGLGRKRD
ncbi:hypothetical protein BG011_003428 [Mortierella polycephala]|uniref:AMP-activated protein kinase glycogen-binding domain-containing protein n=1 Tax=Mortierella polycephala TaxID=41804 RepID=A0A9P6Q4B5_9FUNG|nr:hypothetical protein BG011_003428 [Mortierella polycephala]